jgi:hypothetical protein
MVMTFGIVIDVAAPIDLYDRAHAEITRKITGAVDGLLCHVGRATPTGFQVLEVWESREQYERYDAEFVQPTLAQWAGGQSQPQTSAEEFEPRGLVVPAAQLYV